MKSSDKIPKTRATTARTEDFIEAKIPDELSICGLILCAGIGARAGLPYNKLLHYVGKKTILEITLDRFAASRCQSVTLAVAEEDYDAIKKLTANYTGINLCFGGETRTQSVRKGLNEIGHCDIVVIHDGARPYVTTGLIDQTIHSAIHHGSGILAVPTVDSVKEIKNETIVRTLSRSGLFNIQTPQTFIFNQIVDAYTRVKEDCFDDSEVFEKAGYSPKIVLGDYSNIKITTAQDFMRPATIRSKIGVGFDVHRLVEDRRLILGGVCIPFDRGLEGHSDADALTHAIMDALLSAAGLPDIGVLYPNKDPKYKNANSVLLLREVFELIARRGFTIENISAVIMAEQPLLAPFLPMMSISLSDALMIRPEQITISATTTEKLGIIGEGKGIAASATCLLFH